MAQELVVNTWCDLHLARGEHETGEPTPVIDGRVLDLCKADRDALLTPLLDALDLLGRRADAPAAKARKGGGHKSRTPTAEGAARVEVGPEDYPYRCPLCDTPRPTSAALSAHMKSTHKGVGISEFYGTRCPVCGQGMSAHSGLGMHLTKTHGVQGGIAVGFEWARANGDPAGVVAERLALLR